MFIAYVDKIHQLINREMMKKILYTLGCVCLAIAMNAQNLAGTQFDATMGVMDPAVPCMVDAGQQFGLDIWNNNSGGCPGDATCGFFQNIQPFYNTYEFKNIVNIQTCVTLNFVTGSCGINTGGWMVDGVYTPTPVGMTTDPCSQNTLLQSTTVGGTSSVSFAPEGCTLFSVNYHNGTQPAVNCTYSFFFDPDPLLDLRCANDPAACIEKVKIGGTPVPTMTQWGLFLFGLIVLTLGVVTIYNMSTSRATERS